MDKNNSSAPATPTEEPRDEQRPRPAEPRESPWWRVVASIAGGAAATLLRWALEHASRHEHR